jgi:rhodanese-related sulfurtransferase
MSGKVRGTILEAIAISLLSLILGVVYNGVSEKGVPLIRQPRVLQWASDTLDFQGADTGRARVAAINRSDTTSHVEARSVSERRVSSPVAAVVTDAQASTESDVRREPLAITLAQAYAMFQHGTAVFVDARYAAEYRLGHIKGAVNLPYKELDKYIEGLKSIPKDTTVVTYCDGGECKLSIDLALKLAEMGYRHVRIFFAGWTEWESANYPIEKSQE